jgi:outer membrane protein
MKTRRWVRILGLAVLGGALARPGAAATITLSNCLEAAVSASPDLQTVDARLQASRAASRQAASAYYPLVNLSGSWTRTDNPPQAFFMALNQRQASLQSDFNQPDDTENLRGSVGVQWRLFDGGRRGADRRTAGLGADIAALQLEAARNELIHQVTRAYYSVLQAHAFSAVQEEAVRSIEESLRVATERLKAGGAIKTDTLNLEVQLSQAREDLIRARNGTHLAIAALNTAIGREQVGAGSAAALDPGPATLVRPDQRARTTEQRAEWRAAALGVRLAGEQAARARSEYVPTLSAFGSADWDSDGSSDFEQSYLAGVAAEVNVFDGFRTRSGVAQARAALVGARAERERVQNRLVFDVTQATLAEREAWQRIEVSEASLRSAEEALRITRERYQQGAADITELMTAQVGLTATRTRQVAARYDYLVARSNVQRAVGGLAGRAP